MTGLTVFQKACVAAGTAGSAGGAAFAYAVRRHVDDAEYRVWLRKASPMVADQVDQFLVDYMPQTVKAIRIEEEMGTPEATARHHAPPATSTNLGAAPKFQPVTEGGKMMFGRLEQQPDAAKAVEVAKPKAAAPTPSPTAIGVSMPQRPFAVEMKAEDLEAIAPDEPDEPDEAGLAARWGGGEGVGDAWQSQGAKPAWAAGLLVPPREAERYEEATRRYSLNLAALAAGAPPRRYSTVLAAAPPPADPADPADPAAAAHALASGPYREVTLSDAFGDGVYASAEVEGAARSVEAVRELRLGWLRVQERYAQAEAAALAAQAAAAEREARRGAGGGAALLRIGERRRQLQQTLDTLAHDKREVKRATTLSPLRPDPFPLTEDYTVQRGSWAGS